MLSPDPVVAVSLASLIGAMISGFVGYFFSQLKYRYEKAYDRKLVYLEEIYEKIILLEIDLNRYTHTIGSMTYDEYLQERQSAFSPIRKEFLALQEYFWRKELAIDESTVTAVRAFLATINELTAKLDVSNLSLEQKDYETSFKFWNESYDILTNKLAAAKQEIKKGFRDSMRG